MNTNVNGPEEIKLTEREDAGSTAVTEQHDKQLWLCINNKRHLHFHTSHCPIAVVTRNHFLTNLYPTIQFYLALDCRDYEEYNWSTPLLSPFCRCSKPSVHCYSSHEFWHYNRIIVHQYNSLVLISIDSCGDSFEKLANARERTEKDREEGGGGGGGEGGTEDRQTETRKEKDGDRKTKRRGRGRDRQAERQRQRQRKAERDADRQDRDRETQRRERERERERGGGREGGRQTDRQTEVNIHSNWKDTKPCLAGQFCCSIEMGQTDTFPMF